MVLIECIIMNNCRLCHDKPGQYNLNKDKKLIKEIYDCIKIRVNDKTMSLLPQSICEECKSAIKNFFHYKQHIQKVDKSLRKIILNVSSKCDTSSERDVFKCSDCPATFRIQTLFKNHIKSHTKKCSFSDIKDSVTCLSQKEFEILKCKETCNLEESESFVCQESGSDKCTDVSNEESVREDHNLGLNESDNSTQILKSELNKKEKVGCDICNQKFITREELKCHKKTHKTKYVCSWKNCKKVLNSAYTLKTHELKHADKRSFLCVTCGKGFITKNSLTCHEKIHLDVKGYVCKLCNIGFSVRSNLRAHEKKHHEGVRFYCSQCTKAFVSKCSLERHERIHTGVKEFQCDSCPSAFYTNKELVKHQRYHQGLRLHKCNECFKTFFERHHLVIHLRSHTGERPYVCKVPNCGKSFMESQKLKRHHKAKHAQM